MNVCMKSFSKRFQSVTDEQTAVVFIRVSSRYENEAKDAKSLKIAVIQR